MQDTQFETLRSGLADLKSEVKAMNVLLTGNGTPEKGFIHRTLQLEGWQKRLIWTYRTLIVGLIGGVIAWWFK